MADLQINTCLTQIEQALLTTIANGMQARITAATNAALTALPSASRPTTESGGERAYVTATGRVWQWARYSTAAASSSVLVPDDAPTAGRWLLTSSTSSSGYLKSVRLYDGDPDEDSILTWLFGQVPSVIIEFQGEDYIPKSGGSPGALYWYEPRFRLWCISRNLRGEKQGALGSAIASESAADPGVNRLAGDLRRWLAGNNLGQDGVQYVEILQSDRILSSKAKERGHVYALNIKVRSSIHNTVADDADNPATELDSIDVKYQWVQEQSADSTTYPDNYVTAGGSISSMSGLSCTLDSTSGVIDGVAASAGSEAATFAAFQDTYRYLTSAGEWTTIEVNNNDPIPATPAGSLLVGVTVTAGDTIQIDRLLAARLIDSGVTDQVDTSDS